MVEGIPSNIYKMLFQIFKNDKKVDTWWNTGSLVFDLKSPSQMLNDNPNVLLTYIIRELEP
jgi:hypothetical protein